MKHTSESALSCWTSADESFFLIAHGLFAPDFLAGAGVLLASYDDDVPPRGRPAEQTGTGATPVVRATRATT